jgi:hypothetical protein
LFGQPIRVDSVKKYLSGGFLGMGSSVLDYGDKYVSVTYSKITDSVCPSYIEGEEGSVIIDKITQPKSIVLALRKKDKITLPYTPCENNMVYEISAFKRMTEGEIDYLPYLETTEKVMRIADIIHKTE